MTPRCRSFTLIEMLVVIGIISILAAMLSPALRKAMRTTQQVACLNNLKQMGIAAMMYASNSHNLWLPFDGFGEGEGAGGLRWDANKYYLELLGHPQANEYAWYRKNWRADALCPNAPVVPRGITSTGFGTVEMSYALTSNWTCTKIPDSTVGPLGTYVALGKVRHPGQRVAFTETTSGGQYDLNRTKLETFQAIEDLRTDNTASMAYRHGNNDSVNHCFYDGHVQNQNFTKAAYYGPRTDAVQKAIVMQYSPYDIMPVNW